VLSGRDKIENILQKKDSRLLVILGPCSIHDEDAALEFAERFILLRKKVEETLFIVIKLLL
jgi:3-deoxy-7-phosphoheptulonate synthase